MKRRALALGASLLLLGLMPGGVAAKTASNLDQINQPPNTNYSANASLGLCQTFTAGRTGMLSRLDLNMASDGATIHYVEIHATDPSTGLPTGAALASAWFNVNGPWDTVTFLRPASVTSGSVYAIVIPDTTNLWAYGTTGTRAGGQAYEDSSAWTALGAGEGEPTNLGFAIFIDTVTTQLGWDKASITAGASTALTLTATMTFANGLEASNYSAVLPTLPAWFSVTGLACSAQVAAADCATTKFPGFPAPILIVPVNNGAKVTFTITGTATPTLAAGGTSGTAASEACLVYLQPELNVVRPNAPGDPGCADGAATVQVAAPAPVPTPTPSSPAPTASPSPTPTPTPTPVVTLPPTSAAGPTSGGTDGSVLFLPIGLLAFIGAAFALGIRRRRLA